MLVVMSLIKMTKRVGKITLPHGTPFLSLMVWLKHVVELDL